jgi:predicted RNA binding protein YcfA (HicA-like mRNA interferase family)
MAERDPLESFSMTAASSHSIIAVDCHPTEQLRPGLVRKFFQDFSSHQILRHTHKILNIDKKDN